MTTPEPVSMFLAGSGALLIGLAKKFSQVLKQRLQTRFSRIRRAPRRCTHEEPRWICVYSHRVT